MQVHVVQLNTVKLAVKGGFTLYGAVRCCTYGRTMPHDAIWHRTVSVSFFIYFLLGLLINDLCVCCVCRELNLWAISLHHLIA